MRPVIAKRLRFPGPFFTVQENDPKNKEAHRTAITKGYNRQGDIKELEIGAAMWFPPTSAMLSRRLFVFKRCDK